MLTTHMYDAQGIPATSCWRGEALGYDPTPILQALCEGFYINGSVCLFFVVLFWSMGSAQPSNPLSCVLRTAARKHASTDVFYPAGFARNAHLALAAHPSTVFFVLKGATVDTLDWVIFHDLVYTTRAFIRCISAVPHALLEPLLPRIRRLAQARLSGATATEPAKATPAAMPSSALGDAGHGRPAQSDDAEDELRRKNERDARASEARERFLARKQARVTK